MPIEFPCAACQRPVPLRDGFPGQEATCPHCQAVQPVPPAAADKADTLPNPFASPAIPEPASVASPVPEPAPVSREAAKSRLMIPTIGVIVAVVLGLIARGIPLVMGLVHDVTRAMAAESVDAAWWAGFAGALTVTVVYLLLNFAALQSMSRALEVTSYNYVLMGFILVIVPVVTGPWCVLAAPFSIWGIVVLCNDRVKAAFALPIADT